MKKDEKLTASNLGGEFVLPKDEKKKLVFVAGGIGLTPFRSMIQYLMDQKQRRDIVFFYACAQENDFVYHDIFEKAEKAIGLKVIFVCTNTKNAPGHWKGKTGYITKEMIASEVPDYEQRTFYLSGPDAMVQSYKKLLKTMKIKATQIVTDYFPGF